MVKRRQLKDVMTDPLVEAQPTKQKPAVKAKQKVQGPVDDQSSSSLENILITAGSILVGFVVVTLLNRYLKII
jgi:hypothetical protein